MTATAKLAACLPMFDNGSISLGSFLDPSHAPDAQLRAAVALLGFTLAETGRAHRQRWWAILDGDKTVGQLELIGTEDLAVSWLPGDGWAALGIAAPDLTPAMAGAR